MFDFDEEIFAFVKLFARLILNILLHQMNLFTFFMF